MVFNFQSPPFEKLRAGSSGSTKEKVEVAALIGLQYRILK
jgi:hypothetical protein